MVEPMATRPARPQTLPCGSVTHRRLNVPLYGPPINILFADSAHSGAMWLADRFPNEGVDPDEYDDTAAFVLCIGRWPWVVLPWSSDEDTIAHEAVHAAFEYLHAIDLRSGYSNQEPLAYFVGWLVGAVGSLLATLNLERAKFAAKVRESEESIRAAFRTFATEKSTRTGTSRPGRGRPSLSSSEPTPTSSRGRRPGPKGGGSK